MKVLRICFAGLVAVAAAADDATLAPCPRQTMMGPVPVSDPELPVCVYNMTLPSGAFSPWHVYKNLKVNTPFVQTASKDIMGGETLTILNAAVPIRASQFTCVKEDSEWKARVRSEFVSSNILTMERDDGMGAGAHVVSKCLLQDISLYRTVDGMLGLRLDYGHCARGGLGGLLSGKQAFLMVGLRRVQNTAESAAMPNIGGFFKGVCEGMSGDPAIDLNKAKGPSQTQTSCFISSADMEVMQPLDPLVTPPCFDESTAFTGLDQNDVFETLAVSDSDYDYLLSKLPIRGGDADPCAPPDQPKKIYGQVVMDRACIKLQGINCDNTCGKLCKEIPRVARRLSEENEQPSWRPQPVCIDCEMHESLYAIFATILTIISLSFSYRAFTNITVSPLIDIDLDVSSEVAKSSNLYARHRSKVLAMFGLFIASGAWSVFWYYFINIVDTSICKVLGLELCIRVWPWQYSFHTNADDKHVLDLEDNNMGRWIWFAPSKELNIDVCYFRMWGMILVTWLSAWMLFCHWHLGMKKEENTQEDIYRSERVLQRRKVDSVGNGMFTKMLHIFGASA